MNTTFLQSRRSRRSRTATSLAVAATFTAAAVFGLSGCAQEAPAAPAAGAKSAGEQDREAGWFVNKMHMCISNKTAETLSLQWGSVMEGDDGEYLSADRRSRTLGPDAFNCAVSHSLVGTEEAVFTLQGEKTRFNLTNDWDGYWLSIRDVTSGKKRHYAVYPSQTQELEATTSSGQHLTLSVTLNETLRKVGNVEAYPVDVRIISASN